jgi:hypothetical protein
MKNRSYYAHWLDPDYTGRFALPRYQLPERVAEFETLLKMHAILGDSICINDIQLIESTALLLVFANDGFSRGFLPRHPDFLKLVARPSDRFSALSPRRARICSGFGRILSFGDSYIPATFESAETVPHIGRMFAAARNDGQAENLFDIQGDFTRFVRDYQGGDSNLLVGYTAPSSIFLTFSRHLCLRRDFRRPSPISKYSKKCTPTPRKRRKACACVSES